jgi:hypothetical protein
MCTDDAIALPVMDRGWNEDENDAMFMVLCRGTTQQFNPFPGTAY